MTTRFLALHEASADPEAFGQHHREVHIPLARQLPALRRYTLGGDAAAIRGAPYYSSPSWNGDTMEDLGAAFASPEGRATADDAARLQQLAPVCSMIFTVDSVM
jgi:uncharacterized protein (TIGR02118 family)